MKDKALFKEWLTKIQQNGLLIVEIPSQLKESNKHYIQLCIAAVSQNSRAIKLVDDSLLSDEAFAEVCEAAAIGAKYQLWSEKITKDWSLITDLPDELKHHQNYYVQLCKLAVRQNPLALRHVGLKLMKEEDYLQICQLSVEQDPSASEFVDPNLSDQKHLRVLEMTLIGLREYHKGKSSQRHYHLDFSVCLQVLDQSNSDVIFSYVDAKFYTEKEYVELCMHACKKNVNALLYIDRSVVSDRDYFLIAIAAVQKSKDALPLIEKSVSGYEKIQLEHEIYHSPPVTSQEFNDWIAALQIDGTKLKDVRLRLREHTQYYRLLCIEAVNQNIQAMQFVDPNMMREKDYINMCVEILSDKPAAFDYLNKEITSRARNKINEKMLMIAHAYNRRREKADRYQLPYFVCEEVLKYYDPKGDGSTIAFIDPALYSSKQYIKLCECAVAVNPLALKHIKWDAITDPDAYQKIALASVTAKASTPIDQINLALTTIDKTKVRFDEILIRAVQTHPDALRVIGPAYHSDELYDEAVKYHGVALQYILQDERTFERCVAAVLDNGIALDSVPSSKRERVIDHVTPEKILASNFDAHRYFAKSTKYAEAYQRFMMNVQHVIVTQDLEFNPENHRHDIPLNYYDRDHETKDSFVIYTSSAKRQGKSIRVEGHSLGLFFDNLRKLNHTLPINLVFLGHSVVDSDGIAGFYPDQMAEYAKKYSFINRITLLGCYSADMKKTQDEQIAIERDVIASTKISTFAIMTHEPSAGEINKMFSGKFKNVDEAYVLVKSGKGDDVSYRLCKFAINQNDEIAVLIEKELSIDQVDGLMLRINQNKQFQFPSARAADQIRYIKLPPPQSPLSADELAFLNNDILLGVPRFDKRHPDYRSDKTTRAFLTGADLSEDQAGLILNSLTALLIQELRKHGIDREVIVKGYTGVVSVDNEERKFHTTREMVYKDSYKTIGHFSGEKNVDKKAVEAERQAYQSDEKTVHRSVRVTVGKKLNK